MDRIGISLANDLSIYPVDSMDRMKDKDDKIYELKSIITEIHHDQGSISNSLVAHINGNFLLFKKILKRKDIDETHQWYLFNDFLIQPLDQESVLEFKEWKIPCILQYQMVEKEFNEPFESTTFDTCLLSRQSLLKYVFFFLNDEI